MNFGGAFFLVYQAVSTVGRGVIGINCRHQAQPRLTVKDVWKILVWYSGSERYVNLLPLISPVAAIGVAQTKGLFNVFFVAGQRRKINPLF